MIRPAALASVLLLALFAACPAFAGDDVLVILDTMARRGGPGSPVDRYLDHVLLQAGAPTHMQIVAVTAQGARQLVSTRLHPRPGLRGHQKLAIRHILDGWLAGEPGDAAVPPDMLAKVVVDRLRSTATSPRQELTLILISDLTAGPPAVAALRRAAPTRLEVEALGPGSAAAPGQDRAGIWAAAMAEAGVAWSYLPLVTLADPSTETEATEAGDE